MKRDRRDRSARPVLAGFVAAVVLALGAYDAVHGAAQDVVYAVIIVLTAITIPVGIHANHVRKRLGWYALTAMIGLLAVANTVWAAGALWGHWAVEGALYAWIYPVAYLGLLLASAILVAQRAPRDAGPVIDAALVGVCGAGMLWEWVLRPDLAAGYQTPANRTFVLVSALSLMAALGSLLRVTAMSGRARGSLIFLFISLTAVLAGDIINELGHTGIKAELWIISYLSLAAAASHPAAAHLTVPTVEEPEPVTGGRLLRLGLILAVIPLVGGVPQLFGQPPDGLLLTVGALVTIPLVLVRIGQLASQRTEAQHALAYQAAHDELTALPNRRTVLDQLDQAIKQYNVGEIDQLTVLFCDLDGFKPINDQLGHQVGDEVLRIAASRLRNCVRANDLVGRFGGDEFLIVARHGDSDDLASRILQAFEAPLLVSKGPVRLGISVGTASARPGVPTTGDALVATADEAMYEVKRAQHRLAN